MNVLNELEKDTIAYKKIVSTVTGFENQVNELRRYMFDKYLAAYTRNHAGFTDLLTGQGGNCEAQTKLVVDAFISSGIQMPAAHVLGVQQFKDHVQPVIYNTIKRTVWELISGKMLKEISAPIYAPPILFHAYLLGQGVAPVVSASDLLIVDIPEIEEPNDSTNKKNYSTNTDLVFNGGKGIYNEGDVPEHADVNYTPIHGQSTGVYASGYKRSFIQNVKYFFSTLFKR